MKKSFKCTIDGCNKLFNKSCNLRDHFRMHSGERPFKCPVCDCNFSQRGNLARHIQAIHDKLRTIDSDVPV